MKYLKRNGADHLDHDPLSEKIIGLAIDVHKELGPGFPEAIYHRAMEIKLGEAQLLFVSEAPLIVKFQNHVLGTFSADLVVEDKILVELKALESIPLLAEVQVVSYLKASKFETGLILNFGNTTLQIKRKFRKQPNTGENILLQEN